MSYRPKRCGACKGKGSVNRGRSYCYACSGKGWICQTKIVNGKVK